MKLVDILAVELKCWPEFLGYAVGQAADGTLHNEMEPEDVEIARTLESYTLCKQFISDIVTRAEWQAAVDALNAPKVVGLDGEISDLLREEFDAWFLANAPKLSEKASWLDPDAMAIRRLARHAWQASRECLVIDLPKPEGLDRMSSEMSIQEIREDNRFNRALELAKKSLAAAGVKYK